jgi:hypothetical protein
MMILLTALFFAPTIWAQETFYKGAFVASENFGADWDMINIDFRALPENTAQHLSIKSLASGFNLRAEYGLSDFIGVGIVGAIDNYYLSENQYIQTVPSVSDEGIKATLNLHFINTRPLDLYGGIDYGVSQLDYLMNDASHTIIMGYGACGNIHATGCWHFGQLGLNLSLFASMINYNDLQSTLIPSEEYIVTKLKTMGYGASIGIQYNVF